MKNFSLDGCAFKDRALSRRELVKSRGNQCAECRGYGDLILGFLDHRPHLGGEQRVAARSLRNQVTLPSGYSSTE